MVIGPETFRDVIIPAFGRERATVGTVTRSFPTLEADVLVDRARLRADPATALQQTTTIAQAIDRIGPGQGYLIDNISNTLAVASEDAAAGRRMFLFLGLPGALLAAFLAAYAGSVLAATERREHATLRVRGAHKGHLRTIALTKASVIACVGSLIGVLLGLASATVILGVEAMSAASASELAASALLAIGVGLVITAVALYLPARRSVRREVNEERRAAARRRPCPPGGGSASTWRCSSSRSRSRSSRSGAGRSTRRSARSTRASRSRFPWACLPAPLIAWVGGLLLCVRAMVGIVSHLPTPSHRRFGAVVPGLSSRGLRRRAGDLASGIVGLGLVVAFGVSLGLFAATYDATKAADARFAVGADLRVTPSVLSADRPGASYAEELTVPGVSAVTPIVFDLENAVLIGPHNQKRKNLAAIDPQGTAAVAPLPDQVFVDATAADTIAALAEDPRGVLIDEETADDLSVDIDDPVDIILALGTKRETQARFRVVGLFERFPGTAAGANLVIDLERYRAETGIEPVDFFLASVTGSKPRGVGGRGRGAPGGARRRHADAHRDLRDGPGQGSVELDGRQRERAVAARCVLRTADERHRDRDLRLRSAVAAPRRVRGPARAGPALGRAAGVGAAGGGGRHDLRARERASSSVCSRRSCRSASCAGCSSSSRG